MGIVERKEREKEHRKEEILNAAEQVFFEKGLALATMDEIAVQAELSKGTLYLYYKSKEDLYMAVICKGHQIMLQMFQEAVSSGEPTVQLFQNVGEAYYAFYKRYRDYFRMFSFSDNTQLHSQVSEEMKAACSESGQKICQLVTDVIQKGMDDGTFRQDIDPLEVGVILWASSRGTLMLIDQLSRESGCSGGQRFEHLNFEKLYRKSNSMLVYSILTDEARKNFKLEL